MYIYEKPEPKLSERHILPFYAKNVDVGGGGKGRRSGISFELGSIKGGWAAEGSGCATEKIPLHNT